MKMKFRSVFARFSQKSSEWSEAGRSHTGKISEKKIVFDNRDMDVHGEFDTIEPLQATGDPFDPFALQKACLLACGIIPKVNGRT